ncbi:MAG: hypothetical protein ACTSXV_01095 [Alphaproteobacteria bacterium]
MKKFLLFLFCLSLAFPVFARRNALSELFDTRPISLKINLAGFEEMHELKLHFLTEFPCQKEHSFWDTGIRISETRTAMLRLNCLFVPETILFAVEERYSRRKALTPDGDIHAIYRCPLETNEKKPANYRKINLESCHEEKLPDSFLNAD